MKNFKPIQNETPKEIEKFLCLLDIAATNLEEGNGKDDLKNGAFFRKLLPQLTETMVAQYHCWIFKHKKDEKIETFRIFVIQEVEFQMAASETIHGLHLKVENCKNKRGKFIQKLDENVVKGNSYFEAEKQEKKESAKMHFLWFKLSIVGL